MKDSLEIIADTVIKVKNVVEFFNRSMAAQRKLKEMHSEMHLAPLKLKQDVCTRWNSTYDMLNRFLKIKEALIASIAIMRAELALTPNDWMIIEKSLPILSIFYEVTNEVSAENYVSASKYIVLCKLMYVQIQKFSNETVEPIKSLVSFFKTELMHRFGDNIEKNMLLREATILDPRFKKTGFRDIRNFEAAAADLKLKIGRIVLSD
jgi:zinc finger BED domain-containing protein 1 (E3 SUMO-protein ligase ZBED1)